MGFLGSEKRAETALEGARASGLAKMASIRIGRALEGRERFWKAESRRRVKKNENIGEGCQAESPKILLARPLSAARRDSWSRLRFAGGLSSTGADGGSPRVEGAGGDHGGAPGGVASRLRPKAVKQNRARFARAS